MEEESGWRIPAGLLPPEEAREIMDYWAIGEQEAGLDVLVASLLSLDVPVSEWSRALLAVTVGRSWAAMHYVLFRPGETETTLVFGPSAVYEAFAALASCAMRR